MTSSNPSPGSHAELYARALALYERGDAAAATLFEAVLAADPAHVAARYKLANLRKESGALDAAQAGYEEVLRREPAHAEALNNLGAVCQLQGDTVRAEVLYRQSIACNPGLAAPALNLGRLLQELGRSGEAARTYADAQARGLDAGLFGHLLAATGGTRDSGGTAGAAGMGTADATGCSSARAPASYVRETFDAFAAGFEQRLVGELDYRVPAQLAALVRQHAGAGDGGARDRVFDVLDLGCGTGLVGDALGPLAKSLLGVDLSARMLDEARRKGSYSGLQEADIAGWLATAPPARFDLVVAADVFIYIGDLDAIFADTARVLRTAGLFAFSVEICDAGRWQLLPSGRYAQSDAHSRELAARHGFSVRARRAVEIRRGVAGALYLVEKC